MKASGTLVEKPISDFHAEDQAWERARGSGGQGSHRAAIVVRKRKQQQWSLELGANVAINSLCSAQPLHNNCVKPSQCNEFWSKQCLTQENGYQSMHLPPQVLLGGPTLVLCWQIYLRHTGGFLHVVCNFLDLNKQPFHYLHCSARQDQETSHLPPAKDEDTFGWTSWKKILRLRWRRLQLQWTPSQLIPKPSLLDVGKQYLKQQVSITTGALKHSPHTNSIFFRPDS